ncbi:tyrosine-type recombinase/integrase [Thalassobacter stenotrophicus]|uniref:tyrosine-type recombinase/integrase n=1 Tax=Thalassobacter stenotrophicus TaxID=266809 RepID=UPI000AF9449C|nr:integrase arm-type DNA-binding domain-containing protein [Thalassobacter stenotrophicus]
MTLATDLAIRKWKPVNDGEAIGTGGRTGLYIRGWKSGAKAFYFRAKTWIKLGDYPDTSLAMARELSITAKRLVREGFGVDALRRGFANATTATELEAVVREELLAGLAATGTICAPTYNELWNEWYEGRKLKLQEGPSRRRPEAIHLHHIKPVLGDRPIADIRRREIFALLEPLFREKPVTAGHALGHIQAVFERAANKELIEADPTPRKSAFSDALVRREVKHHGTLAPERMPDLWQWLGTTDASDTAKLAILTAMTTGHRIGVVVHAEWTHIDDGSGVWTVPARTDRSTKGRMKSGREYALRLPEQLLERLKAHRTDPDKRYVFESPTTMGPITPNAIRKSLKRFNPELTAHGFRNAIKVWCRTATPPVLDHIADAFCDHSLRGLDTAYRRVDTSTERAELAARLYNFVTGVKA